METLNKPWPHKMAELDHAKECFPPTVQEVGEGHLWHRTIVAKDTCGSIVTYCNTEGLIWKCEFTWWFILVIIVSVSFFIIGIFVICFLLMGRCFPR